MTEQQSPARLLWSSLRPFVRLVVLECIADDVALAFQGLERFLAAPGRCRAGREIDIVAVGSHDDNPVAALGIEQLGGFVRQRRQIPSWADPEAGVVDVIHGLTLTLRRGRLVAVHTEDDIEERLQRWLNREPKPPFRRISDAVLENALLQGQAKGLWLRGTHRPSTTRPDTKSLGGQQVQDALNPIEDSSFAMAAAKAELEADDSRAVLQGTIGTTPRRSSVWFKASEDFHAFATAVTELLALLEETQPGLADGLRLLARSVTDLSDVSGAYDLSIVDPDLLAPRSGVDDDLRDAALLLRDAVLNVHGQPDSANLVIEVGLQGVISGSVEIAIRQVDGRCVPSVGFADEPTDGPTVRRILNALSYTELLTIYYRTGHAWTDDQIWTRPLPRGSFQNWQFEDFTGYRITQEKPPTASPQEIHNQTGGPDDFSLFGWVVQHFREGWLICDDGADEVADFLHISNDGLLSFIHVKKATGDSPRRGVSAQAFEVVVSQAVKNLYYTDRDELRRRLMRPTQERRASWTYGQRVADRCEFIGALDMRDSSDAMQVVIVQPHVSEMTCQRLRAERSDGQPSDELLRMRRLEDLLRSARASAVGSDAELVVIGSRT